MPIHHQQYRDPKLHQRAAGIGPNAVAVIDFLFQKRAHPELAIRAASGVLGLVRDYNKVALEAACGQAIKLDAVSYKNIVQLLLSAKQGRQENSQSHASGKRSEHHENLRGADAFDPDTFDCNRTINPPPISAPTSTQEQAHAA